ncbi:Glutaredoxin domain protein [Mycena kentingensis (nom. inval.)]|nr:Glutaredoxin domain protein [Mycena kentingensis (nom. inval.)]
MEPKRPSPFTRLRRRRIFFALFALVAVLYFFGFPRLDAFDFDLELPGGVSRANIVDLVRAKGKSPIEVEDVPELYGLLHLVTSADSEDQHILTGAEDFDPTKPVAMSVYAGGKKLDWGKRRQEINQRFPLVVFSKTYCPFSKRAKKLLATYQLSPAPTIVEVDLRDDAEHIKTLLTRLTSHSTFPNVILLGTSLGGSDDVHALHNDGRRLKKMLERAGLVVGNADI